MRISKDFLIFFINYLTLLF